MENKNITPFSPMLDIAIYSATHEQRAIIQNVIIINQQCNNSFIDRCNVLSNSIMSVINTIISIFVLR